MITISGGKFQYLNGTAINGGYLVFTLSQDELETTTSPNGQVAAGISEKYGPLDSSGNLPSSSIWSNAELSPAGSYYKVMLTDANGIPQWFTNQLWIFTQGSGSSVDLGSMVPATVPGGVVFPSSSILAPQVITFSSSISSDVSKGSLIEITLTGNVTSSTIANMSDGQLVCFSITQDATGGRTFAWPANVIDPEPPDTGVAKKTIQLFICIGGTNLYPLGGAIII